MKNYGDSIEMPPLGSASAIEVANANDIFEPTRPSSCHGHDHDSENINAILENSRNHDHKIEAMSLSSPRAPHRDSNNTDTSRRVKKNYLSMIMLAYALTIISPGTVLWTSPSSPSSCRISTTISNLIARNNTSFTDDIAHNDNVYTNATTSYSSNHNNLQPSSTIGKFKCMYGTINIPILAKLSSFTILLILLFFNLQGSSPGILTKEVMDRLKTGDDTSKVSHNDAKTINDNESEKYAYINNDNDLDLERQSFLEPLPMTTATNAEATTLSLPQQRNHQGDPSLYPHTRRKYCSKCQIHPPLRSHHCNVCNACIATFDHHCHFLDTCIGERNHCRFWMFLTLNVICCHVALGIVGSGSGGHYSARFNFNGSSLGQEEMHLELRLGWVIQVLAKLYMYPIYFMATLLWLIHTSLALSNTTTFEVSKGSAHIDYLRGTKMMDFPFGKGLFHNVRIFFLRDHACVWLKQLVFWGSRIVAERRIKFCWKSRHKPTQHYVERRDDGQYWVPVLWKMPEYIIEREAEDWWNHPWQNKYWSCC